MCLIITNNYYYNICINYDLLDAVRYSQQLSTCLVFCITLHLYDCAVTHVDRAVCMNGPLMVHKQR